MTSISWNCQGLGLPWKIQFLSDFTRQLKPNFVFLCETLSRKDKMEWVRVKLGYDGVLSVEPQGRSGGLAILWKDVDHAKLLSYSQNHIDMEVMTNGMMNWRLTGFYGEPMRQLRKRT